MKGSRGCNARLFSRTYLIPKAIVLCHVMAIYADSVFARTSITTQHNVPLQTNPLECPYAYIRSPVASPLSGKSDSEAFPCS
jgi:hypothetical protein